MIITFLHDEPEIYPVPAGGKERCIMNLARELSKRKVISKINIITRTARIAGKKIKLSPKVTLYKFDNYDLPRKIVEFAYNSDILSVHLCSFQMPNIIVPNCKIINHIHDIIYATVDRGSHLDKTLGASYSALYSPSEFVTTFIKNLFWWSGTTNKIITIPRGVDLDYIKESINNSNKYLKGLDDDTLRILDSNKYKIFFPNRLNSFKGEYFIEGITKVLNKKSFKYTIFMPENKTNNKIKNVKYIPWLTGKKLYAFYSKMNAVINLSLNPESFSQVVIDSVASKVAVLCFPFGNLKNLSLELPSVVITKPSASEISKHIIKMLSDPKYGELKDKSYDILSKKYSIKDVVNSYIKTFDKLTKPESYNNVKDVRKYHNKYCINPYVALFSGEAYIANGNALSKIKININEQQILLLLKTVKDVRQLSKKLNLNVKLVEKNVDKLLKERLIIEV
ncbi:MAG: hypothetical protein WC307_02685 [Candidatus Nanoarchaeia archaeon]|jgi:hypothetical protein